VATRSRDVTWFVFCKWGLESQEGDLQWVCGLKWQQGSCEVFVYPLTPSFAGINFLSGWSTLPDSVVRYQRPSVAIGAVVKNLQRVLCGNRCGGQEFTTSVAFSFSHS